MIDDSNYKVYHCVDLFNKKSDHFICKNPQFKINIDSFFHFIKYHIYIIQEQSMLSNCQKTKKFELVKFVFSLGRRLEIQNINNIKMFFNLKKPRKLNYLKNQIESISLFKEIYFDKNHFEFYYKYQSQDKIKKEDLIFLLDPKNECFYGEVCFSQNLTWLINKDLEFINCYYIDNNLPVATLILLKKEIIDEKELYIYIKGKTSGIFEIYDLTKEKILNINSSYFIPYINNFIQSKCFNFRLPKISEDIYINILINNYNDNNDA